MASLAQNVDGNPRHVPWNNKNTEFEERWQNMMGSSCMKDMFTNALLTSMAEKVIIIVPDIPVHHPQESQQIKPAKEIPNKEISVETIRFVALP